MDAISPSDDAPDFQAVNPCPPDPSAADDARRLGRWFYTHNPFYSISAALVFWGLRSSFETGGETFETQALMVSLLGYTALLAGAACFLIRFGKVWDDVRSVVLLVVLMFLAISVTFDDALAANPRAGMLYFFAGLAFAVITSETMLWGMRLRLPALFRGPYYLILALFFLYPVAISPLFSQPYSARLHWGLFGFSVAAGLAFLTLLPAVRRGAEYVRDGGCPWRWPLYPWVLFGVLALGVCGRAYYLPVSFLFVRGTTTIFAPYFFVPLLLALDVLLLEMGIVAWRRGMIWAALAAPAGILLLAVTPGAATADDLGFLSRFSTTLGGSPLFLTLAAAAAIYLAAAFRRVAGAADALCVAAALAAVCGPATYGPETTAIWSAAPLVLVACVQLLLAWKRQNGMRAIVGLTCLVAAASLQCRGTAFTAGHGLVPLHLILAAVLLVGAIGRDRLARLLQAVGAAWILAAGIASLAIEPAAIDVPPLVLKIYPVAAAAVAAAYGLLVANRWYLAAATGVCAGWLSLGGWQLYRHLRQSMAGLDYVIWGTLSLLVAMLISLSKAGLLRRPANHRALTAEEPPDSAP
jgi:hypothetical protein